MTKPFVLAIAFSLAAAISSLPATAADSDDVLVFCFFRDNGQDGTYMAWSEDGIHYAPLNKDRPVFSPANWPGQNLTRDPSIVYHEGKFHVVWTTNWNGSCFAYTTSSDLVRWSKPVRVEPFPDSLPRDDWPNNIWAPEICWDPVQKNFAILWSTTTNRGVSNADGATDGDAGHRIYITRTADGRTFSPAELFFNQNFCCIDGQMVFDNQGQSDPSRGRWLLVLKNEREIASGGKNLLLTSAPADFSQPWAPVGKPIVGPGSAIRPNEMAEGPVLVQWQGKWFLYWDAFADGHYCVATSTDLINWTDRTVDLRMPPHPRHGTVFRAPRSVVANGLSAR